MRRGRRADERPAGHRAGGRPAADDRRVGRPRAAGLHAAEEVTRLLPAASFTARTLLEVRRRGWAHSVAEREPGVASLSAPVRDGSGAVLGAVSISGPVERLGRRPSPEIIGAVLDAAAAISRAAR
ncbi:IclR family transcriptional regulator domain-containing protein [Blastococcus sp. PRF04-17]|uniref:IclR family transcriptional regulator domain-containing protein n=1 Tax=Blastococcus sp. PRF04-17 TaxID=2933797 RepID=UPI003F8D55E7